MKLAQACPDRAMLLKCPSSLEISFSCIFGWHLSMWLQRELLLIRYVPVSIDDFIAHCLVYVQHEWVILVLLGVAPRDMRLTAGHHQGYCMSSAVFAPSRFALRCHLLLWGIYFCLQKLFTLSVCCCSKVTKIVELLLVAVKECTFPLNALCQVPFPFPY